MSGDNKLTFDPPTHLPELTPGVGDEGHVTPKIRGKYWQLLCKIRARIMQNSGILLIFNTYFSGKNFVPP